MPLIECLAKNNDTDLLILESDLTVARAMDSTQLRKLSDHISKINVVKAITFLLLRLSGSFNVGQKLSNEQASILALDLFEIFAYETLEDVVLMLKYARQGRIGDGRDFKLDGQTVMHKWVPAYLEIKADERERQHNKSKGEMNGMASFKWDKEAVDNFNVSDSLTLPNTLGSRVKERIGVEEKPQIVLKDRKQYLTEMYYNVRNMTDKQLKDYLVKVDVNGSKDKGTIPYDADVYLLVEKEIDKRNESDSK